MKTILILSLFLVFICEIIIIEIYLRYKKKKAFKNRKFFASVDLGNSNDFNCICISELKKDKTIEVIDFKQHKGTIKEFDQICEEIYKKYNIPERNILKEKGVI